MHARGERAEEVEEEVTNNVTVYQLLLPHVAPRIDALTGDVVTLKESDLISSDYQPAYTEAVNVFFVDLFKNLKLPKEPEADLLEVLEEEAIEQ